jgi:hypothetical protein
MSAAEKKWEEVQKKAFTHWVNAQLARKDANIEDLETGFVSGVNLITLVEVLSGKKIPTKFTKSPKLKVHKINNCFIALQYLQVDLAVKGVTISAEDIVNGDRLKLILGFCWLMLRTFQEPAAAGDKEKGSSFEASLLQWVKETLSGYSDINLSYGFKSESWYNGKAILALLDAYDSNILKGSYSSIDAHQKLHNCEKALSLAEQHIKLPNGLIDPAALSEGAVSESNLVLYLSLFYNSFKDKHASNTKESLEKRLKDLEEKVRFYEEENATLRKLQEGLHSQQKTLNFTVTETTEEKIKLTSVNEEIHTQLTELRSHHTTDKTKLTHRVDELTEQIKVLKSSADSSTTNLQNEKDEIAKERDHIRDELKATKEKLTKEKEEIAAKNEELSSNLKKANRLREELEEISKQQEDNNQISINVLRKHLIRHIQDMQTWKVYLERDREYKVDPAKIITDSECEKFPYRRQLMELNALVVGENRRLGKLIGEREVEAAEVVSVNIGKKKKRIKKNDPLIEVIDTKGDKVAIDKAIDKGSEKSSSAREKKEEAPATKDKGSARNSKSRPTEKKVKK